MTLSRHGHHLPGTTFEDEFGQIPKARCGGVAICTDCQKDLANAHRFEMPVDADKDVFEDAQDHLDDRTLMKRAKLFVVGAYNNRVDKDEQEISISDLRIIWWSRPNDDWTAIVETKDPEDSVYFQVIHDSSLLQTIVKTYAHVSTDTFSQEGFSPND